MPTYTYMHTQMPDTTETDENIHTTETDENILPLTLSRGPTGVAFDLRHGSRSSPALMEELARVVLNVSARCPASPAPSPSLPPSLPSPETLNMKDETPKMLWQILCRQLSVVISLA